MAIEEKGGTADSPGEPVFLYTIQTGGASHSYGIEVAKLAGLPDEVVKNARTLLQKEEGNAFLQPGTQTPTNTKTSPDLSHIDISRLTPLEALNLIAKWKEEA
jgi:DNA mismatch repair protein MutS